MVKGFRLYKDSRGQGTIEALLVFPLLFMLFWCIVEFGFLMYDWAVISYNVSTSAVTSATVGQFNDSVRLQLAQNIQSLTSNGKSYTYNVAGTSGPATMDGNTVYIWGTDKDTRVQKGDYIRVNVSYPIKLQLFLFDALGSLVVNQENFRLNMDFAFPSEVYFESL